MAEAQFKCPETQPTPARAEEGRGNGAAPLPRGPARARTHAAGSDDHTRRPGAEGKTHGATGAGERGTQSGRAHARRPAGPRALAWRAGSRARMRRRRRGAPWCSRATERGGEGRPLGRETLVEQPTQSLWASQVGRLAVRTRYSSSRAAPCWAAGHACLPGSFHIALSAPPTACPASPARFLLRRHPRAYLPLPEPPISPTTHLP